MEAQAKKKPITKKAPAKKKPAKKKATKKVNTYSASNDKILQWVERTIASFEKTFPGKTVSGRKALSLMKTLGA